MKAAKRPAFSSLHRGIKCELVRKCFRQSVQKCCSLGVEWAGFGLFVFVPCRAPLKLTLRGWVEAFQDTRHSARKHFLATCSPRLSRCLMPAVSLEAIHQRPQRAANVLFCVAGGVCPPDRSFLQGDYLQRQHLLLHAVRRTHLAYSKCVLK